MLNRWKRASLRSQLVAIMMVLLTAAIVFTGAGTLTQLHTFLVSQVDSKLKDALDYTRQNQDINLLTTPNPFLPSDYTLVLYTAGSPPRIYAAPATTRARPDVPALSPDQAQQMQLTQTILQANGTDHDSDWRYIAIPVRITTTGERAAMLIALPLTNVDEAMNHTLLLEIGVGVLTLTLVFFVASWTVTRAFRPLRRVEKTAAAIAAGDLSQRVDEEAPGTELGRLSSSLNAMLAHIERAFRDRTESEARMRRFVSDASHELRTPLVTIRGFSELYRHGALATTEDVGTAMGRIESEAKRMGTMVEDLLTLARLDEQRPVLLRPVDLLPLGHDAVVDTQAAAPDRTVRLVGLSSGQRATAAPALGDEGRLRQVVGNLVGNALRYTPPGSPLEVAVGVTADSGRPASVLELRDHGPGISERDAPKIFERFYRADTSRTRETGGTGLGLAIVAAIVGAHGGTVRHRATPGGGATFVIELPFQPIPETPPEPAEPPRAVPGEARAPQGEADAPQQDRVR
ncbi:HAMP domain-containing sensor histidine kinase [Sinomonas sp. ASV322]|uniref:sensor histidine kinase n=1 Tax=Sinomonas sp. ASV322 TaxID=3041920 RepID=UPI0027DD8863|nr:HAMP domain-containing sensor histidine kinase [Sinomonas sp. ASV322]MDQ4503190.1 HAMP domain-containing sensor histidine kinase [Sinomonas sp. ASV322]